MQAEKQYPYIRKYFVVINPDGSEEVREDKMFQPDFLGFYTLLAAEMGDEKTRVKLLERADKLYDPVWVDGTYHYKYFDTDYAFGAEPAKDAAKPEKCGCSKKDAANSNTCACSAKKDAAKSDTCGCAKKEKPHVAVPMGSLGLGKCCKEKFQSDNVQDRLFGMSRALPKSGLWKMYNQPFDKEHFTEPAISDVDIKTIILKRAVYDRSKRALVVSTIGSGAEGNTGFKIINLNPGRKYVLADNGGKLAELSNVKDYEVKFNNKVPHDFVLVETNAKNK